MTATEHEHWTEQAAIFALGALDGREREEFEAHLAAGCPTCEAHIRETREALIILPRALTSMIPPPAVKTRLLDQVEKNNVVPITAARAHEARPWRKIAGVLAAGIVGIVIGGTYYRFQYEPRHTVYSSVINLLRDPATRDYTLFGTNSRIRSLCSAIFKGLLSKAPRKFVTRSKSDVTSDAPAQRGLGRSLARRPSENRLYALPPVCSAKCSPALGDFRCPTAPALT